MADTKNSQSPKKKVDLTPTDNNNIFLFDIEVPAESVKDIPKKQAPKKEVSEQASEAQKPAQTKKPAQAQKPAQTKKSEQAKKPATSKKQAAPKHAPEKKRPQQERKLNKPTGETKKLAKEKKAPALEKEEVVAPAKQKESAPTPPLETPEDKGEIKLPYVNKKPAKERDFSDGAKAVQSASTELPKFLAWFIPTQNDKMDEIIRKGLVIICIIVLIFSMGILIKSTHLEKKASDDNAGSQFVNKYVYSYEIYDKSEKEK